MQYQLLQKYIQVPFYNQIKISYILNTQRYTKSYYIYIPFLQPCIASIFYDPLAADHRPMTTEFRPKPHLEQTSGNIINLFTKTMFTFVLKTCKGKPTSFQRTGCLVKILIQLCKMLS